MEDTKNFRKEILFSFLGLSIVSLIIIFFIYASINIFGLYGNSLFVSVPFCCGIICVFIQSIELNISNPEKAKSKTLSDCIKFSIGALLFTGFLLIIFSFEGLICILMSSVIVIPLVLIGTVVGFYMEKAFIDITSKFFTFSFVLLIPPSMIFYEINYPKEPLISEVKTCVNIKAPPEKVWKILTSFPKLQKPEEIIFKVGISYPLGADIDKKGMGGLIKWKFNTGEVHEKITKWTENNLIEYDVIKEAEMMTELSPYEIHPEHLNGYFSAKKGSFKLSKTEDGYTSLEGYTLYSVNVYPANYWTFQSDYLHKKMQLRVLNNIKNIAEK